MRPVRRAAAGLSAVGDLVSGIGLRARLMLLYSLLFLLGGAILVWVTYLLTERAIQDQFVASKPLAALTKAAEVALPTQGPLIGTGEDIFTRRGPVEGPVAGPEGKAMARAEGFLSTTLVERLEAGRAAVLADVLRNSVLIMLGVGVAGVLFGWAMTGRALSPLRRMTSAAERLSESTLHERIALRGPRDDVKRLADTFDAMLDRLQRAFDGQRRFVSNASHELRTPIAINRTLIEVALEEPDASDDLRALGRALLGTNARHERLIEGLLLLARSEQEVIARNPVDLRQVVRGVLDQAGPAAERRRVTVTADLPQVWAAGEALLLERCVFNLVENAVKYNLKGGGLMVRLADEPGEPGEPREVVLTVENDGVVIPPHDVAGLFEPFRRLHDRIGSSSGSGLGLSIVRAIAVAHGGSAAATARPDGGLSVVVRLPAAGERTPV
ncbi:two-component sensor histidine kinase [Spongiactinospora rosea]|uniref:histidine kinase n=1 Tax=Spongiactinospora rosea TaxID=2248750 RepID=A0A366M2C2_9ACTN|nr:ATP-binding protein [Spongiactinospora rosea]RBQ19744.1 two-component sensor histidine kinase [Spongiactinospora rosea]